MGTWMESSEAEKSGVLDKGQTAGKAPGLSPKLFIMAKYQQ